MPPRKLIAYSPNPSTRTKTCVSTRRSSSSGHEPARGLAVGWTALLLVLASCQNGEQYSLGQSCVPTEGCGSRFECEPMLGVCTEACTSDSDCVVTDPSGGSFVCGVLSDGRQGCLANYCDARDYYGGYGGYSTTCIEGVPTACTQAPEAACLDCGCPNGSRCDPGVGCVDLSDVGGPCLRDQDCRTLNCSVNDGAVLGQCYVPVLAACERNNCALCTSDGTGFSFCSRPCSGDDECNGGLCIGTVGYDGLLSDTTCRPRCNTPQCSGGTCKPLRSGGTFCDCTGSCTRTMPQRAVGGTCNSDDDCISGHCYATTRSPSGFCTDGCTSNTDCGDVSACVSVECVGSGDPNCGSLCLRSCDPTQSLPCGDNTRSTCRAIAAVDGGSTTVCDVRSAENGPCTVDSDCQVGRCAGGLCTNQPGTPSGGQCTNSSECRAGVCNGGTCVGTAVLGDPCELDADCSVGSCCSSGPSAHTCASSC